MNEVRVIKLFDFVDNENRNYMIECYADECKSIDAPEFSPDWNVYKHLEEIGALIMVGAYCDEKLVGFSTIIITKIPHYSCLCATVESVFVLEEYRNTGIGIELIKGIESISIENNAESLFMSAPINGSLNKIAKRYGFNERALTYHKKLF